jgi:hypothetical protein
VCILLAYIGALFVAIAPVAYLILAYRVSLGWFLYGAFAWAIGLAIKKIVWFALSPMLKGRSGHLSPWNAKVVAAGSGLWSGVAELSTTAAVFLWLAPSPSSLVQLVAFGVGAGSLEVLHLYFIMHDREERSRRLEEEVKELEVRSLGTYPLWSGVLERAVATVFHVISRLLLYLSLRYTDPLPGLIALAGFTILDGVAYYGHDQKWDWLNPRVIGLFHAFALAVTLAVVLAAFWFLKEYSI